MAISSLACGSALDKPTLPTWVRGMMLLQLSERSYRSGTSSRFARYLEADVFAPEDDPIAPIATASIVIINLDLIRAHRTLLVTLPPANGELAPPTDYSFADGLFPSLGSRWRWVVEDCAQQSAIYIWNYRTDGYGWEVGAIGTRLLTLLRPQLPCSAQVVFDLDTDTDVDEFKAAWIRRQFVGVQRFGLELQPNHRFVIAAWGEPVCSSRKRSLTVAFRCG